MDRVKSLKPTFAIHQRDRTAGLALLVITFMIIIWHRYQHRLQPATNEATLALLTEASAYYDSLDKQAPFPSSESAGVTQGTTYGRKEPYAPKSHLQNDQATRKITIVEDNPVNVTHQVVPQPNPVPRNPPIAYTTKRQIPKREIKPIDINKAEELDWESLPGIGPYYAGRIIDFRERLGGFTSVKQVGETWQLPDSTFQIIKPYLILSPVYRRMDLNAVDVATLASHPYLSWKDAKLIVRYRDQHGRYLFIEDLLNIHAFDTSYLRKVIPYFKVEPFVPPVTTNGSR